MVGWDPWWCWTEDVNRILRFKEGVHTAVWLEGHYESYGVTISLFSPRKDNSIGGILKLKTHSSNAMHTQMYDVLIVLQL